jgi:hypothetical protein
MGMNTLRKIWDSGLQIHQELYLTFENKNLVKWEVRPERVNDTYTREVVESLVKDLRKRKMITFWDDVPNLDVSVPIWEIGCESEEGNDDEPYYIETFHHDRDVDDEVWRDDCNVPVPLHKFMGFRKELNVTDF